MVKITPTEIQNKVHSKYDIAEIVWWMDDMDLRRETVDRRSIAAILERGHKLANHVSVAGTRTNFYNIRNDGSYEVKK